MSYNRRGRGGAHNNYANNFQAMEREVMANSIPIEIVGWNGASSDECIAFIQRKTRVRVFNHQVDASTGILKGYVNTSAEADTLVNWLGVQFARQPLKFKRAGTAGSFSAQMGQTGVGNPLLTIEMLQQFLRLRYRADIKMLNLSGVKHDPNLSLTGFFLSSSTLSKFFPALMKVAEELKLDAVLVDLLNNDLLDISSVLTLAQAFPQLANLLVENNQLKTVRLFDCWKHKLNFLRELVVGNNPVVNNPRSPQDVKNIKLDFMKLFPRLVVLNGETLRDEAALSANLRFGFDLPDPMFFADGDVQATAAGFVTNFYNFWDANRGDLMILYQAESQFSMKVDSAHPHLIDGSNYDFGYYIPQLRNLTRISDNRSRTLRLAVGPEAIFKAFNHLPKSRHALQSKPGDYSMEAWRYTPLNGIIINLHGCFEETAPPENPASHNNQRSGRGHHRSGGNNKKLPLESRCFDRTFIVLPGPNGLMIVASDMLTIRPFTAPDAWAPAATVTPAPLATATPPPALTTPVPGAAGQPGVNDLPPEIKANYSPVQQELLVKVVLETKLNLQYAVMLCEQSQWDYQQCIVNFKNSAPSLPQDAYL